jgi:hypothetical protein
MVRSIVVGAVCAAGFLAAGGTAFADDDTWSYWGDNVSRSLGERSTAFDDGGITTSHCTLTLRVKKYEDVAGTPGWLQPIATADCDAHPGVVGNLSVTIYDEAFEPLASGGTSTVAGQTVPHPSNHAAATMKWTVRGHHCFIAQGVKNGSLTGEQSVTICGTW